MKKMEKTRNFKLKLISVFLLLLVTFNFIGVLNNQNVYAEINKNYGTDSATIDLDEDKVIKSSPITDYIGSFIFTIGELLESITSNLVAMVTGDKVFPWADKVIFNTIPLLDVNFINPAESSLLDFNNRAGVGTVIRDLYFTGVSIALGFLGIIVAVMAIKLAISTIASEKAKYKEAIVKWLTAIVLLFGMHFGLAMMFYLNEQLVVVASDILQNVVKSCSADLNAALKDYLDKNKKQIVLNFCQKAIDNYAQQRATSDVANPIVLGMHLWDHLSSAFDGHPTELDKFAGKIQRLADKYEYTYALLNNKSVKEVVVNTISGNNENEWYENAFNAIGSIGSAALFGYNSAESDIDKLLNLFQVLEQAEKDRNNGVKRDYVGAIQQVETKKGNVNTGDALGMGKLEVKCYDAIIATYKIADQIQNGNFTSDNIGRDIISQLGQFFKENAWYTDVQAGGWSPTSVSVVGAILYTVFVVQSISFFIAYLKRFFYVVVLSVIAPFVVIYDFFVSSLAV